MLCNAIYCRRGKTRQSMILTDTVITGIKTSKQYRYWVWHWQPIKILPSTQYYQILVNIGQYQYPNTSIVSCNPNYNYYCMHRWNSVKINSALSIIHDYFIFTRDETSCALYTECTLYQEYGISRFIGGRVVRGWTLRSRGRGFDSRPWLLCTNAYSACHPSGVG